VAAAPDDDAPYLVLADALSQHGDPRGELIAVQHARATATGAVLSALWQRETELLDQAPRWFAPMAAHGKDIVVGWRNGFASALRICAREPAVWPAVLATPLVRETLTELRVDGHWGDWRRVSDGAACQRVVDALATVRLPALRRLHVNTLFARDPLTTAIDLAPLADVALDELTCAALDVRLGWRAAPTLRALEVRSARFDVAWLASVPYWPQLRSLVVWASQPGDLSSVVTPARFPALRELALIGTAATAAVARALATMPIVDQLDRVSLWGGTLEAAEPVAALAARIPVDVGFNLLGDVDAAQLGAAGRQRQVAGPLLERETAPALRDRWLHLFGRARDAIAGAPDDAARARAYRAFVDIEEHRLSVELESRIALARDLGGERAGDALAAIATTSERELLPALTTTLCGEVARWFDDNTDVAEPWAWRALQLARWTDNADLARDVRGHLGVLRLRRGDRTAGRALLDAARIGDGPATAHRAWLLRLHGAVALADGDYAAAAPLYRGALAMSRARSDRAGIAAALADLAAIHWWPDDHHARESAIGHALARGDIAGADAAGRWHDLGMLRARAGRLDEAREAVVHALRLSGEAGDRVGEAAALALMGELARRQLRHAEARQLIERALVVHRTAAAVGNLALVAIADARYAEARALCRDALAQHDGRDPWHETVALRALVDIALGERDDAAAAAAIDAAAPRVARLADHAGTAALALRRGMIAALADDADGATAPFDAALADARRSNDDDLAGVVELWIAATAARRARTRSADAALARAHELLARRGAPDVAAAAALAMATAVVARCRDRGAAVPAGVDWDTRMLARMTPDEQAASGS
jgi:uncharacterized protein (TIGR02996 family)